MLAFIARYIGEHRKSPLIREIQFNCGIVSYKSVVDRLNALERKALIKRAPNKHRGITLARQPVEPHVADEVVSAGATGNEALR